MSARVDDDQPGANMYGCTPCPRCGSVYRYPFVSDGQYIISCDDCDSEEPVENPEDMS